jgi:hypothetical protein
MAFSLEFVLRFLWVSDKKTVISGGDGVELWPRKLATAKFFIEDMKTVKGAVANAVSAWALLPFSGKQITDFVIIYIDGVICL